MSTTWLPLAGGIVPTMAAAGPQQQEELLGMRQSTLEDARAEYQARHYEATDAILDELVPSLRDLAGDATTRQAEQYALLLASALVLKARVHWRHAQRERMLPNPVREKEEREKQQCLFKEAIDLFRHHKTAFEEHIAESRLRTDFGIALYRTGHIKEALEALNSAVGTGAASTETFGYLGMSYSDLGQYPEALRALRKGVQLAPRDKVLLETLAHTHERAGDIEVAVRTYCKAAVEAGKIEDLNEAQSLLRRALRLRPDDPQTLSMLTLLLRSQGKGGEAHALLDNTLRQFPNHPWALGLRGMLHQDEGRTDEALADFSEAHVDSAELAWIWLEQAKALAKQKNLPAAKRLLSRAGKLLDPNDARLVQARVQVTLLEALARTTSMATDVLRNAASWLANSQLGRVMKDKVGTDLLEQFSQAFAEPEKALESISRKLPNDAAPLEALARLHLDRGEFEAGADQVDSALQLAPDEAKLLSLKAEICAKQGNKPEALLFYWRAVRVAPNDDGIFFGLISALLALGRRDEALREIELRIVRNSPNGRLLAEKGRLLVRMQRFEESVEPLQTAEKLLTDRAALLAVRIALGQAQRALNRYAEASATFDRAMEVDNDLEDALVQKARLLADTASYQNSAELFRAGISRLPPDLEGRESRLGWMLNALGWVLYADGYTPKEEIEALFREAVKHAPDQPWIQKNLGQLLLKMRGHEDEGTQILERLTELSVNRVPINLAGWCHYRLGHYEAAEQWLRAAAEQMRDDCALAFDLALVLLVRADSEAQDYYLKAKTCAEGKDKLRQRGLFHIAWLNVSQAIEDGILDAQRGMELVQDLLASLQEAGLSNLEMLRQRGQKMAAL